MPLDQPRDLLSVLQAVVQDKARSGLRVEFNEAGLRAADQLCDELAPATTDPPQGLGLAQSVRARIEEIGGTVHIDSAPGASTHIELSQAARSW